MLKAESVFELDVAGDRPVIQLRRHVGLGQEGGARALRVIGAADADVAVVGGALLILADEPDLAAVVGDQGEVDVGLAGVDLGGLEKGALPGAGAPAGVEVREHGAGDGLALRIVGQDGAVGHEADGDQLGVDPGAARDGVGHFAGFQLFDNETGA